MSTVGSRTMMAVTAALTAAILTACQAPTRVEEPVDPRTVPVFAGDGSGVASWSELVETCSKASVVLIGETHGHPLGLPFAADLYTDILQANSNTLLSMEFYERDDQVHLDDYVAGLIDAEQLDAATQRNSGNNPAEHRRMVDATRAAGRPIIAANAPRRYARLARTDGYDRLRSLTNEQRRLFDIPDALPNNGYAERFHAIMGGMMGAPGHSAESDESARAMVESFYRAQVLWDETMAESVAEATDLGAPVVHVVGRFHSEYGTEPGKSGLADAVAQRLRPDQNLVIITVLDEDATTLRVEDVGRGHFVVYVGSLAGPEAQ